jgi:hypothetical protein
MKNKERQDRYLQLHHFMLKTEAWRALTMPARALYVQVGSRYTGFNNGRIAFSVRDAANECGMAKNTAMRAFKELIDLGFTEETLHGGLNRKTRRASEWRLTAFKCDLTGALKTCRFMQRGARARDNRQPRSRPQADGRLSQTTVASVLNDGTSCLKRRPQDPLSVSNDGTLKPVLGGSPVSNDGTLISNHGVGPKTSPPECPADTPGGMRLTGTPRSPAGRPGRLGQPTSGPAADDRLPPLRADEVVVRLPIPNSLKG